MNAYTKWYDSIYHIDTDILHYANTSLFIYLGAQTHIYRMNMHKNIKKQTETQAHTHTHTY